MDESKPLRILILAPGSNPESVATALVGYAHSAALARLHTVTLVANDLHEAPLRRSPASFHEIVTVPTPWINAFSNWLLHTVFKGDYGSQVLTALGYPWHLVFEWKVWRMLKARIERGEYDVVLRLLPVVPVIPSLFSFVLRRSSIPFVIGPLNGGLPWPQGFTQAEKQKEWISGLRDLYRFLPFSRSTFQYAKAIIAGSSHTYAELKKYHEKMFFIPENGLSVSVLKSALHKSVNNGVLELCYVGRLVPFKACDMALRGAAALLKARTARLTIIGDGPERKILEQLAEQLGIEKEVVFKGWLSHDQTMQQLQQADIMIFPSIREFGGGVVFEALALGAVPIVVDYGGPGDIVTSKVGFKVALTNEQEMVGQIEKHLWKLARDRAHLAELQAAGMQYAKECLSWEGKAKLMTEILRWAIGKGSKPNLHPVKSAF